jgi:hypothetical protein
MTDKETTPLLFPPSIEGGIVAAGWGHPAAQGL